MSIIRLNKNQALDLTWGIEPRSETLETRFKCNPGRIYLANREARHSHWWKFKLPITKTLEQIEEINKRTREAPDIEPLHYLVNFEVAGVWLSHSDSISLSVQIEDKEWFPLSG